MERTETPIVLRLRKALGLSQIEFAELTGLSKSNVSALECGDRRMTDVTMYNLCNVLQLTKEDIEFIGCVDDASQAPPPFQNFGSAARKALIKSVIAQHEARCQLGIDGPGKNG